MSVSEAHLGIVSRALALDLSILKPHMSTIVPRVDIPDLLIEYKKFMALKIISNSASNPKHLSPSPLVDKVWHIHLLHTVEYRAACIALGATIEHSLTGALDDDRVKDERLQMTLGLYVRVFKKMPPSQFWLAECLGDQVRVNADAEDNVFSENVITLEVEENTASTRKKIKYGGKIKIQVIGAIGKWSIMCDPSLKFQKIEDEFEAITGIPKRETRFVFNGLQISGRSTVGDHQIKDGDVLEMFLVPSGC